MILVVLHDTVSFYTTKTKMKRKLCHTGIPYHQLVLRLRMYVALFPLPHTFIVQFLAVLDSFQLMPPPLPPCKEYYYMFERTPCCKIKCESRGDRKKKYVQIPNSKSCLISAIARHKKVSRTHRKSFVSLYAAIKRICRKIVHFDYQLGQIFEGNT
jgi:hypothetical protein